MSNSDKGNKISRDKYNFDNKTIELNLLGSGTGGANGWGEHYENQYFQKYQKRFLSTINMPLSIDDAKKLFGEQRFVYEDTLITVRPKPGISGFFGGLNWVYCNYDIIKITKKFYRKDTGFVDPVLVFKISSSKNKPLY